ncbi:GntR family transcriptional regulator [Streptomyces sp. NPDC006510]|uniref:winged helix-turn-helix domain-containing protein n=1 Tax=Streptomyces sp. NPDC006510 TaxID=3155600 RepID=UPI0033BDC783
MAPDGKRQYRRIADELLKGINSEVWRPGDRLSTQARPADRFGVSRATITEALRLLRDKRLIVTRQGNGTFVSGSEAGVPSPRPGASAEIGHEEDGVRAVASESIPPVLAEALSGRGVRGDRGAARRLLDDHGVAGRTGARPEAPHHDRGHPAAPEHQGPRPWDRARRRRWSGRLTGRAFQGG